MGKGFSIPLVGGLFGKQRRNRMMAIIAAPETPPIVPPTMGPILLVLPVFPWLPIVVGNDMDEEEAEVDVGSDNGDETRAVDGVLGPENEGVVVKSAEDALQIR